MEHIFSQSFGCYLHRANMNDFNRHVDTSSDKGDGRLFFEHSFHPAHESYIILSILDQTKIGTLLIGDGQPTLLLCWGVVGVMLGLYWGYVGVILPNWKHSFKGTCVLGFFDALSGPFVSRGPPRTTHNRKSQNSSRQMGRSYKAASKTVAIGAGHLGRLPMSRWTALPTAIPAPCPVSRKPNSLQNIFSG